MARKPHPRSRHARSAAQPPAEGLPAQPDPAAAAPPAEPRGPEPPAREPRAPEAPAPQPDPAPRRETRPEPAAGAASRGPGRRPPATPRADRPRRTMHRGGSRASHRHTVLWFAIIALVVLVGGWVVGQRVFDGGGQDQVADTPAAVTGPVSRLTIPEGLRREDIAQILDRETSMSGDAYLEATKAGPRGRALARAKRATSLEGFLFPATYEITPATTVDEFVDMQVAAYEANTADINYAPAARKNLTRFDVLTIASMIEREVAVPAERPLVASVIENRLRQGMSLGIDATVQYAIGEWKPELTVSDLDVDSPYNTRKFTGLPPGPISNPGKDSLNAASRPRSTDYLYYVARNDGTGRHYFSTNAADFERDVARSRANGGG